MSVQGILSKYKYSMSKFNKTPMKKKLKKLNIDRNKTEKFGMSATEFQILKGNTIQKKLQNGLI